MLLSSSCNKSNPSPLSSIGNGRAKPLPLEPDSARISRLFEAARIESGLTYAELGSIAGVSDKTAHGWCNPKLASLPPLAKTIRLARQLPGLASSLLTVAERPVRRLPGNPRAIAMRVAHSALRLVEATQHNSDWRDVAQVAGEIERDSRRAVAAVLEVA